jgi:hypothetical protein
VKKFLILAGAALLFTACAESATAPSTDRRIAPQGANHDDFCGSGYIIAYDEDGNPYCVPVDAGRSAGGGGSANGAGAPAGTTGSTSSGKP